jgi:hypothetical protein
MPASGSVAESCHGITRARTSPSAKGASTIATIVAVQGTFGINAGIKLATSDQAGGASTRRAAVS